MKINIFSFLILISILFLNGCSNKNQVQKINTTKQIDKNSTISEDNQDEELDSFDDEFDEPEAKKDDDPFKGYNIMMTNFNDKFYTYVFNPVARGYKKITNDDVRQSVRNFFDNLMYPIRFINNLLQGKIKNATEETGRFIVNTTVGIFGLFDPAKKYLGWEEHKEDFGQTLGYWGVGSGPYIVLPILGPSNARDMFSIYPDYTINPIDYNKHRAYNFSHSSKQSLKLTVFKETNEQSYRADQYDEIKKDAVDLYPYLKNIYTQHREKLIKE